MKIKIREEKTSDYKNVFFLIEKAFREVAESDHSEQFLVSKLRRSDSFIKKLSLVAEVENKVVGHILLSKVQIKEGVNTSESLVLATVSVLPTYQNKGIGKELIEAAHEAAKEIGFKSVVLIGHPTYYPKFGYRLAKEFDIKFPFKKIPKENSLVKELVKNGLKDVKGMVEYPKEFS
ncbi:MAG: putative N-acetyltransferase YhbS [Planctomycetota bacterium]|jgi:predicted N-acetyltransferase YhbS